jgi:hypothetical protein
MVYALIEAFPNPTSTEAERYGGGMVSCWIQRDEIDEAVSVARRMIAERGWHSQDVKDSRFCTRDEFPEESRRYFDQALIDHEVLVFFTYPKA